MSTVFLALGSNKGDSANSLNVAAKKINEIVGSNSKLSQIYKTKALTRENQGPQPDYLNAVIQVETRLSPTELLKVTKQIEEDLGRNTKNDWAPRTIDIDILFYDDEIIDLPELKIPHPCINTRDFVLRPLADLAPQKIHPVLKQSVSDLLANCSVDTIGPLENVKA